ncbi:uncharacterized protein LOC142975745 isoform X2 [Anticarsia gemmatalis]|uniref:uncharacterized protein LOC142975745 isoform X2 n=1 Tax=Anticarsia gemmatalis TaxID=129554 RepID=UPI003F773D21
MEKDKIVFKGSHPDSLYRVPADSSAGAGKVTRVLRLLRWPVALLAVCIALAVFVYFLMPDNLESNSGTNGTYWQPVMAGIAGNQNGELEVKKLVPAETTPKPGSKTSEIDFYDAENDKNDVTSVIDIIPDANLNRKLPIPPVFPTHLTPEVQYGNEKADSEKRKPKILDVTVPEDTTLKPHITQKPEKPLAIYFKDGNDATTSTTETIARAETINDFANYDQKQASKKVEEYPVKTHPSVYKEYPGLKEYEVGQRVHTNQDVFRAQEVGQQFNVNPEPQDLYARGPSNYDINFTSGHSKLFGISIEDAEKMKSTTQSSLYNTRVSPTLPTWRDGDDTTTKKYPINTYSDVQCRSTRMTLCRDVLPYDLAGAAAIVGDVEITSLLPQVDYLVATNCSDRIRHFVCALLEPECSPPPYPSKKPCYNLCKAIVDSCDGYIPRELTPAFECKQYTHNNCIAAKSPCYNREFTCGDSSCIPRDWICDGRNDCPAGEDEIKCVQCEANEFKCPSGGCILKRWMCDGYKDCSAGEDETEDLCGPRHVQAPADRHSEPGEESAGSAPAPAVRRPNKVPTGQRKNIDIHKSRENDSSKELLMTSDSNNAYSLSRNIKPSLSRLMPYNRTSSFRSSARKNNKDDYKEKEEVKEDQNAVTEKKAPKGLLDNESIEDVNMGDLGFFDEFEKEKKFGDQKLKATFGVPPPKQPSAKRPQTADEPNIPQPQARFNKNDNKFERVIDGGALLRKAAAADAAEAAEAADVNAMTDDDMPDTNNTYIDREDFPNNENVPKQGWGRAHASPCPSGELRCVDGRCITLAQLCDGTIDCTDHADEDNCYT